MKELNWDKNCFVTAVAEINHGSCENSSALRVLLNDWVSDLLFELGITPKLKGFDFLRTAIVKFVLSGEEYSGALGGIFAEICKDYGVTRYQLDSGIRNALKIIACKNGAEQLNEWLGVQVFDRGGTIACRLFISVLSDKIRRMLRCAQSN